MKVAEKYTHLAEEFTERSYADPELYMGRRAELVLKWGPPLHPGDRVLELACGDGYLGCLLAERGLRYVGVDVAPGMVHAACRRAQARGARLNLMVADMDRVALQEEFDAVVYFARSFFTYSRDPSALLQWMRAHVRKKILVDWNRFAPLSLAEAKQLVMDAGFVAVEARAFLVPMTRRVGGLVMLTLRAVEHVSPLALALAHIRFAVLIKGEVEGF